MPDEERDEERVTVNIADWVERVKADPVAYRERQATEVFLVTLGMTKPYSHEVFLKGGILMGVVYDSPRQTGDIDFTTIIAPQPGIAEELTDALNANFPRAAVELGYPDLMCRIQSHRYFPKGNAFSKNDGPAVRLRVGYAMRDSRQQKLFDQGKASDALAVDISFKEPVGAIKVVRLGAADASIRAYSLRDLIAEKLRALLQQEVRNRERRQDIYDVASLLTRFEPDAHERRQLHGLLLEKCAARGIDPGPDSLEAPEIVRRARRDWDTLKLERTGLLPDFDTCFTRVNEFYRSLPWQAQ